jgi:hypothetical protein
VQRLFRQWWEAWQDAQTNQDPGRAARQVFVTASATLRDQVAASFRKLQVRVDTCNNEV